MKLVISPAKSLNYTSELPTKEFTQSCFLKEAEMLNNILKNKSPKDLSKLMSISSSLGDLNYERNQSWSLPFSPSNSRQAIYAFNGDVYKGIDAYSIPINKIDLGRFKRPKHQKSSKIHTPWASTREAPCQ